MKTFRLLLFSLLPFFLLFVGILPSAAQDEAGFFTVSGTVRDGGSRRPMANVSVSVPGSPVGTISNADGTFSLKIRHDQPVREVEFSHVGYLRHLLPVSGDDQSGLVVDLTQRGILLREIDVHNRDAQQLVEDALSRVGSNYSDKNALLTGFYRETVQKRLQYIDISEAVVEVYATPYTRNVLGENVRLVKGRRLVSPRTADTLSVVLQGGPNTYVFANIVKNPDFLLNPRNLHFYRFSIEDVVLIDERLHDVVGFTPRVELPDESLFIGKLFIDRETLTISRAEFGMDMSDQEKVIRTILRKKPASLRFYPDEVSFVLSYRERDGRSYLNYIGNTMRFRCDWRRRFFRTHYTVTSEMVITDAEDEDVARIPYRESFRENQALSEKVGDFYDPDFWEAYNIIEPTESLESAVDRIRKRME